MALKSTQALKIYYFIKNFSDSHLFGEVETPEKKKGKSSRKAREPEFIRRSYQEVNNFFCWIKLKCEFN